MFSIESQFSCWDHCLSIEQPEQHKVTTELHRIIRFKGLSNFWGMQIYVNPSKPKHNVLEKRFEDWKGLKNERIWKINYMLRKKPQEYQTLDAKLTKQQKWWVTYLPCIWEKNIRGQHYIYSFAKYQLISYKNCMFRQSLLTNFVHHFHYHKPPPISDIHWEAYIHMH